jgi:hypothetical protein
MERGDFTFRHWIDRKLLSSAFNTVEELNLWGWLSTYEPPKYEGFIFDHHDNVKKVFKRYCEMYPEGGGSEFGIAMRHMQFIAQKGWDNYVAESLKG